MDDVAAADQPTSLLLPGQAGRQASQDGREAQGSQRSPGPLRLGGREFAPGRALVMAIVNRTPDSFYKPGLTWDEGAALERVHAAVAEGADILDVGGVPAKPGPEVTAAEEIRRVVPFIERVRAAYPDLVISADTWRHEPARIVIDPAHDFGKNTWHSLEITRRLAELAATGWPVLVSLSNKDFVGETLDAPLDERVAGTLATTAVSAWLGARVFRVHQVRETRHVLRMVSAIRGDTPPALAVRGLA